MTLSSLSRDGIGQTPAGGTNMDLAMMAAGGGGGMLDPMLMDPMMMAGAGAALPNQCCTHGALHCTVPGAGADPSLMMAGAGAGMLPPIDPMAAQLGGGGLYDLTAMRTPHGGIKPPVKVGAGVKHEYFYPFSQSCVHRKPSSRSERSFTTRRGPARR